MKNSSQRKCKKAIKKSKKEAPLFGAVLNSFLSYFKLMQKDSVWQSMPFHMEFEANKDGDTILSGDGVVTFARQ